MKPILVLSIPHTGTMFTYDLLPGARGVWGDFKEGHKYWAHWREPRARVYAASCFVVVPLRSFERVVASWRQRRMDLFDLYAQWEEVNALRGVFFLTIDALDRDEQLAALSQRLGTELRTDWKPTNCYVPNRSAA